MAKDELGEAFLDRLASEVAHGLVGRRTSVSLPMTFPAVATAIGDVVVESDGTELTVYVGKHTHCHFALYMFADLPRSQAISGVVDQAIDFLRALFNDEIVIWSSERGGGTFERGDTSQLLTPGAEAFLWSGARYFGPGVIRQ